MTDAILYVTPALFKTMVGLMVIAVLLTMVLTIFEGVEYLRQRKS